MATGKEIIEFENLAKERNNINARNNPNIFRQEVIINDITGGFIKQEPLHETWISHITKCKEQGKYCAILAPWGSGKTVQMIAEILYMIGHNQELRIKIINSQDTYAMDRVKAISNYIENSSAYRDIFPWVVKDENQQWTDHRIYIKRQSKAIDPTIEARGITSKGVGGRADILIFDDPVDEDSISSEKIRESIRMKYQNLWLPRLSSNGFIIYIATRWSELDLTATIIESGRYLVLIQKISEDFKSITQEVIE